MGFLIALATVGSSKCLYYPFYCAKATLGLGGPQRRAIRSRTRANRACSEHAIPSYSYRLDVTINGLTGQRGEAHFQEVAFVLLSFRGDGYAVNPFGGSGTYLDSNGANDTRDVGGVGRPVNNTITDGISDAALFEFGGVSIEKDNRRPKAICWLIEHSQSVFDEFLALVNLGFPFSN
ncbi:hypothetical protein B0J13DRAFT_531072 [Dactylonectria estremocensis]|uniref:Uncharacterized protein n=1 Tax=Dactylonectria estremocensis TaxID=1079267 RepID=A0A9P9DW74_9HYPO|nr:hypothetical protein B0J13DRAFT_531072 [Dactylonectria estremocensis]